MFKLDLKIAFRNLLKNKLYAAINIGGLALGLTAFTLLLLYVNHEDSYDTWSEELKSVYQLREYHAFFSPDNKQHWQSTNDSRNAALLKEKIPQVLSIAKISIEWGDENYALKADGADPIMSKGIRDADSAFFKVMPYRFIQGSREAALNKPFSMVLKRELALKLFGTEKVLGKSLKIIRWHADPGQAYTVTGVVDEPKGPETSTFSAVTHTGSMDRDPDNPENHSTYLIYVKIAAKTDTARLNRLITKVYEDNLKKVLSQQKSSYADYTKAGHIPGLKVISLRDVHKNPSFTMNWLEKIKPVVFISIFLLLISIINFINLATAQSVQRAKEVGVKKVMGCNRRRLVWQFLMESTLQTSLAFLLCIILLELALPIFNQHFDVKLCLWNNNPQLSKMTMQLTFLFIVVSLLAGFYPAWILSDYNPVVVLKGNYENSAMGVRLRNILVVLQFSISVVFIICIGVMQGQSSFMSSRDLGFNRSNLININSNYDKTFAERIKRIPGVQYVATTTQLMGNVFNVPVEVAYDGNKFEINTVTVSMDALPALKVKVLQGRIFSTDYKQDTVNAVVLNESAVKEFGGNAVGKKFKSFGNTFQIIGVIKDYNSQGFDKPIIPTVYKVTHLGGMSSTNNLLVRFDGDNYRALIDKLRGEWKKLYPEYPMQFRTVEDNFRDILAESDRFKNLVLLFSCISAGLSLLGLFALSTFVTKRRRKEIAVRKVLGASNLQIVNMLNRSFIMLVGIANLLSWPVAYILMQHWLEGFAYRITMPIFPFIMATLASLTISILTISMQAKKAALSNPVLALKYE